MQSDSDAARQHVVRIAIIGGGAGAREFIIHLMDTPARDHPVSIKVFEPRPTLGRGLAWTHERTPVLANMRLDTLGPSYADYDLMLRILRDLGHPEAEAEFPTRNAVGEALDERWRRASLSVPSTWRVQHIASTAVDIHCERKHAHVLTDDGETHRNFDIVLLALGNLSELIPAPFAGSARFINGWDTAAIERIEPDADVLVRGAGLTAIDATLRMLHCGHRRGNGSIVWQSRSGTLPFVRPRQLPLEPEFLSCEALVTSLASEPPTLASLWNLFTRELHAQAEKQRGRFASGTDYEGFLALIERARDSARVREFLDEGIAAAEQYSLWFSVAKLFDEYTIPILWNALPEAEKALFLRDWRREFDRYFEPIPVSNAVRIAGWISDGTLHLLRGDMQPHLDPATGRVSYDPGLEDVLGHRTPAELAARYQHGFDYIIDAGGIPSDLDLLDSPLVHNLQQSRLLIPRKVACDETRTSTGLGAQIDWTTGAVLHANSQPSNWLYALAGSLTIGAHYYTNSFMAVSASARRSAIAIASQLAAFPA